MLTVIMMCGTPCSGKTTWIEKNVKKLEQKFKAPVIILSRDIIREDVYGSVDHVQTKEKEDIVTERYYKQFSKVATLTDAVIILDNTHAREKYIKSLLSTFNSLIINKKAQFFIKLCEAPYWKKLIRNYRRKVSTGKFIPVHVMKDFHKRMKKIKQLLLTDYKQYLYNE